MLKTLAKKIGRDEDFPARTAELALMTAVLDGTLYDCLEYEFHQEKTDSGEYIPIAKRQPSVRYNLCRLLVEDSIALLFGEGRFPSFSCSDVDAAQVLNDVVDETGLSEIMQEAAFKGSVGSVAILIRVLKHRLFFDVMDTLFLTPEWNPEAPDTLLRVTEAYKVKGSALRDQGYTITDDDLNATFWFQRVWDDTAEIWFLPWRVDAKPEDKAEPVIDKAKTVTHDLGFVPIVWIKNLRGAASTIDGACTFKPAIDSQIEIEYQLSQGGRGLRYSSDPTLLIKEPAAPSLDDEGQPLVRSAANAIVIDADGDAKMLEINGTAVQAVIEYVNSLRELALESIHGNRSSADKVSGAQSGRALEMLHQSLIWLADKLRTSYGERGLLPLIKMIVAARRKMPIQLLDQAMPELPATLRLKLTWPPWFHLTEHDKGEQSNRIGVLYDKGLISQEQAVIDLAEINGVADPQAELKKIAADTAAKDARAQELAAQVKASETLAA